MNGYEELYNNLVTGKITQDQYDGYIKQIQEMKAVAKKEIRTDEDAAYERAMEKEQEENQAWMNRQEDSIASLQAGEHHDYQY